ncbi:unnamed protein product [Leptidea sinapis]|uniref:Uncharacterized protein n=1 Tax=Leptidea sinapis TaxID=189913 RepID=A0A5E4QMI4_9NEOP|nr:unnamed protein product [Leptidea sinapis]
MLKKVVMMRSSNVVPPKRWFSMKYLTALVLCRSGNYLAPIPRKYWIQRKQYLRLDWKTAQHYLEANNYPNWVHISKVVEGIEPTAFKQHFQDWN